MRGGSYLCHDSYCNRYRVAARPSTPPSRPPPTSASAAPTTSEGRRAAATSLDAMFSKVLVANRGEIAIRAFRAAYELGARTVAVFPHEDRGSVHRLKADEAYEIGERGHPVRAYLDPRGDRRGGASGPGPTRSTRATASCRRTRRSPRPAPTPGITFVGPTADVLQLTGNKAARDRGGPGRRACRRCRASSPRRDARRAGRGGGRAAATRCSSRRSPAAAGAACGGSTTRPAARRGRGLHARGRRRRSATRRCSSSRRWSSRGTSRCRSWPTATGEVIHLFERDCSVQRRHQKVVELAPAPDLDPELRERICADAVRFAREIGYRNAGTVEFLLDRDGHHVFIEMNPRIQVEHTVTEEVTDVDLVQCAAADRGRRDAGRPRACRRRPIAAPRCGAAVPDHHRGPGQRLPPRHRPDHDLPLPRRRGRPPRRRDDVHRRRGRRRTSTRCWPS